MSVAGAVVCVVAWGSFTALVAYGAWCSLCDSLRDSRLAAWWRRQLAWENEMRQRRLGLDPLEELWAIEAVVPEHEWLA